MTPNMMPITSESKMKGVFYHAGHGHLGWTLSAETANQVVAKARKQNLRQIYNFPVILVT